MRKLLALSLAVVLVASAGLVVLAGGHRNPGQNDMIYPGTDNMGAQNGEVELGSPAEDVVEENNPNASSTDEVAYGSDFETSSGEG